MSFQHTTVGINGFGRIGRNVLRVAQEHPELRVAHINDVAPSETLAHLLRYDSNYGPLPQPVHVDGSTWRIGEGPPISLSAERDPQRIPWAEKGVTLVLECSGHFNHVAGGKKHLEAGAKQVLFSAPAKDAHLTLVKGVNLESYDANAHRLISNASCTTNCLAPVAKVLHEAFGLERGLMLTIHAYTNDQSTLDQPHADLRRARAAALSMIPTSTGAAKAIGLVLPQLAGRLDGLALRVPTPTVSMVDLTATLARPPATAEAINAAFVRAAAGPLKGILACSEEPLVSVDYKGNPHSAVVDALSTSLNGDLVKVLAWYDNEWAFSHRMVEVARAL